MKKSTGKAALTAAQLRQLDNLAAEPDISDIPEAPAENWAMAERGKFFKPRKAPVSLRLDMDVVDWLKRKGPGYQTEINAILRRHMERETQ